MASDLSGSGTLLGSLSYELAHFIEQFELPVRTSRIPLAL
jgi:hypothetical protein